MLHENDLNSLIYHNLLHQKNLTKFQSNPVIKQY